MGVTYYIFGRDLLIYLSGKGIPLLSQGGRIQYHVKASWFSHFPFAVGTAGSSYRLGDLILIFGEIIHGHLLEEGDAPHNQPSTGNMKKYEKL